MVGKRTVKKAKTTALFTGLDIAAACVYVAVAYDFVSAAGYDGFAVGYVFEGLLIATTTTKKCHNYNVGFHYDLFQTCPTSQRRQLSSTNIEFTFKINKAVSEQSPVNLN